MEHVVSAERNAGKLKSAAGFSNTQITRSLVTDLRRDILNIESTLAALEKL